ncbi:hypothetical protein C8034_v006139 [Colletotrichum sidae]|uniref:Uncharacterized protein n=1 Tax=Colletotrichum sidae TaxID=1347389 RepID=A0A4R8T5B7_9PEZI|nr:hypothetical protein C8034_v006139 [Colletotrichum sidae]
MTARQPSHVTATETDSFSLTGIFSRDQERAWEQAESFVGSSLEHGKYYYFMSCDPAYARDRQETDAYLVYVISKTECAHVGLVIGKTSSYSKKFEAEYLHVKHLAGRWAQTRHDWDGTIAEQYLVYDGMRDSVSMIMLWMRGMAWVMSAGSKIDEKWNCLTYYDYMVSGF